MPILTGSMEPGTPKGSLVVTEPVRTQDMKAGDVIALMLPEPWTPGDGLPTVHRITGITRDVGDAYRLPHLGGRIVQVRSIGPVVGLSLLAGAVLLWCVAKKALRVRRHRRAAAFSPPTPVGS
ncbi:hypothetical protein ACFXGI_31595 [Streptomyces sp. NPDC059355]|uniref:hypothetical protein n=1 Tax=Streptomyces sp. NPDC059355 TaxID=3346811 RepID=UPI00369EE8A6